MHDLNNSRPGPVISVLDRSHSELSLPKKKRSPLKITLLIILLGILIVGGILVARAVNLTNKIFVGQKISLYQRLSGLIQSTTGDLKLIGENNGQINLLLLGIGGQGHDGPYLSDTIMLVQIRPTDNKISLISIPRDYFLNIDGLGYRKINAAFAEGFAKNSDYNEAGALARQTVENISGLSIPYFAVIDFQGFDKAIDQVGGVDINVERTFTDYTYPNDATNGYLPPVTFKKGLTHMDGKTALIFARSRHAAGPEGSDYARSRRQQLVMSATKQKILQLNLIADAGKINSLLSILGDHFHTNLSLGELYHLYTLSKGYSKDNIISLSFDPSTGLICDGTDAASGAFIISACPGKTPTDIKAFFNNSFTETASTSGQANKTVIWLADSSSSKTLLNAAQKSLTKLGFSVFSLRYSGKPLQQTIFYEVNPQPTTAQLLKDTLEATEVSLPPPGVTINPDKVDAIVILGNAAAVPSPNSNQ